MIDLIEGNGQNQSLGTPFEVLSFNLSFFLFKSFFYVLTLFLGFVYAYICLCSLVLCLFGVFKHIRLLDLSFQVLLCFFSCLFFGLRFKRVYIRILLSAHVGSKYAYTYIWPMYVGLCMRTYTRAQKS